MSEGAGLLALPLPLLEASKGFRFDARFTTAEPEPLPPEPEPDPEPEDPAALAYSEGFAAGMAKARAEADEHARSASEARGALALSFTRLDNEMIEQLERQLRETVVALCESALAPLALDETALLTRIKRAAAMLARTDDERVIRLHPDDFAFVSPQFPEDWQVKPDASLQRGSIRVDGKNSGAEDSPEQWSCALREVLGQC